MRTRVVLMIAVWAVLVVGAVRLFRDAAVPAGVCTGVAVGAVLFIARARRRTPVTWVLPTEGALPPGPRRVPLLETGLVLPE